jgi:hypothetical protein
LRSGNKEGGVENRVTGLGEFSTFGRFFTIWAIFHHLGDFSPFGRFFATWAIFTLGSLLKSTEVVEI